ncbi:hypothetical protein CON64_16490 [Bacillus pseudomycoides]|nr:hypothetical protein CON64_16490 [Bacillus pseudomycoides]
MNIRMEHGLPIASFGLHYDGHTLLLDNVLLDTGCATTIFDTDVLADVGIELDVMNGKPKRMYGVGGYSEPCYEQEVMNINIDKQQLDKFLIQLGITKESYGFDGILGMDYMRKTGMPMFNFIEGS